MKNYGKPVVCNTLKTGAICYWTLILCGADSIAFTVNFVEYHYSEIIQMVSYWT